ncbi:flagellar hook-length control protein FliK [Candidatus Gottesmanbacteria bacterium]|nr:flagellar hook-length control protein FliK [Candidatus Gottesmanbacteria bacterium]
MIGKINPVTHNKINSITFGGQNFGDMDFSMLLGICQNIVCESHKFSETLDPLLSLHVYDNRVSEAYINQNIDGYKHIPVNSGNDIKNISKLSEFQDELSLLNASQQQLSIEAEQDKNLILDNNANMLVSGDKRGLVTQLSGYLIKVYSNDVKNFYLQDNPKTISKTVLFGDSATRDITNTISVIQEQGISLSSNYRLPSTLENKNRADDNIKAATTENPMRLLRRFAPRNDRTLKNNIISHHNIVAGQKDFGENVVSLDFGIEKFISDYETLNMTKSYMSEEVIQKDEQWINLVRPINKNRGQVDNVIFNENPNIVLGQSVTQGDAAKISDYIDGDFLRGIGDNKISKHTISQLGIKHAEIIIKLGGPFADVQEAGIINVIAKLALFEFNQVNSDLQHKGIVWRDKDNHSIDKPSGDNEPVIIYTYKKIDTPERITVDKNICEVFIKDEINGKINQSKQLLNMNNEYVTETENHIRLLRRFAPRNDRTFETTPPNIHEKVIHEKQHPCEIIQSTTGNLRDGLNVPDKKSLTIKQLASYEEIQQIQQALSPSMDGGIRGIQYLSELENRIFMYINNIKLTEKPGYISIRFETKDLGNIKLRVHFKDNKLSVCLIFDRLETMKTMEMQISDIRRNLVNNQIQMGEFKLSMDNGTMGNEKRDSDFYDNNTDKYKAHDYKHNKEANNEEFGNLQVEQAIQNIPITYTLMDFFI